ncbi:hypothetical protein [Carboxylicivirga marina]|uniref:Uncharacterized protein n=1 Tax=Carboxylicivirga marina TaxID=2800988 RepID=A0ABS1HI05_9BACT|nr:hypothetical protein [Carboxylicivirga marina]MBK3517293.1 hypothetical protein [Carboxylicivirga marina]
MSKNQMFIASRNVTTANNQMIFASCNLEMGNRQIIMAHCNDETCQNTLLLLKSVFVTEKYFAFGLCA